jgi:hypothetical protein
MPKNVAHVPTIVAKALSFSANQFDVTLVGALYRKGQATPQKVYPTMTHAKLLLTKHLSQQPKVVVTMPITTPVLSPYLSRAETEGKQRGTKRIM